MDGSIKGIAWKEQGDYFPKVDTCKSLLADYGLIRTIPVFCYVLVRSIKLNENL